MLRLTPLILSEYGPAAVGRRRLGNLGVFLVVGASAAAMGYVPWQVPALLIPWIAGVWLVNRVILSSAPEAGERIEAFSYCLDAVWLTVVCYYLGGADWIASAFYVLLVMTAAGSLPMGKALPVAALAWMGFSALALVESTGLIRIPEFGPVRSGALSLSFAVLTIVIQGTTLALALLLQQSLLGALRRSEARHRAILNAASDMVVVLDRDGVIQGAGEVFAERTAFPIRGLVGSRFTDVVDSAHREAWSQALRAACSGEHAPFEIAYRSRNSNRGWISGTLVPLPVEDGEARVLMIARDVSAQRVRQTHAAKRQDVLAG